MKRDDPTWNTGICHELLCTIQLNAINRYLKDILHIYSAWKQGIIVCKGSLLSIKFKFNANQYTYESMVHFIGSSLK